MPKVELTDVFCRTAKPIADKQTDYFDTNTIGLCLRASPGGTKTWQLLYTRPGDGKRARMKLGRYPELRLATARTKAREGRAGLGEGQDPVAEKRAVAASQTVADLVENYIARHASTKRTSKEIARRLRKNVVEVIGSVKLSELHRRDISRCLDLVKDRGAGIEANRLFQDIRTMVRWARGRGDLDTNIMEGMKRPTEEVERDRVLTAGEIRTMWSKLPEASMAEATRDVLRLCLITGQRVGEICGMRTEEVDLERGLWTIPAVRSKNKRDHVVPLSELAMEVVNRQAGLNGYVFPAPGGRAAVSGGAVAKAVKRAEKADGTIMGVVAWTPHDLRRSAARGMEEIGVSPFIVGHVLNHISITKSSITSRVYARYDYAKEKREALVLWADRLAGILRGAEIVPLRSAS